MWKQAVLTDTWRSAVTAARVYRQEMLRLFGIPESEIAETLRHAEREGVDLSPLEITTCLRSGEIEIVTRYESDAQDLYDAFAHIVATRHADTLYSTDGTTIDAQVAALLRGQSSIQATTEALPGSLARAGSGRTIAVAESCTGGLLLARLTDPPGASDYVLGGVVAYSNEAKVAQVGVPGEVIEAHGAVSEEVARALADGARARFDADLGVGVTGIAGPGGGSEDKPVGLVWTCVVGLDGARLTRSLRLPGGRTDVRERAALVAMHLIRRLLMGERDGERGFKPGFKDCVRERVLGRLRSREISRPHALHDLSGAYAEQMSRNPTARLFVAVDPPEEVCDTLAAWARSATLSGDRRVRPNVGLRVLDPELLHVTLCFLGNRPAAEMDVFARALVACEGQACELSLGAPLWLPERNPRALAVELHDNDGRLGRMQTQVLAALREVSGWQPGGGEPGSADPTRARQRFRPHVTVARMGRAAGVFERALPPTPSLSFIPTELLLYRSWLSPQGASYETIASHPIV